MEVAVDLAKAFAYVRRDVLLREAKSMCYLADPILASLCVFAMKRRLVYRGCVGGEMHPKRGIGAGSAFATRELYVVMARSMERLQSTCRSVVWNVCKSTMWRRPCSSKPGGRRSRRR